MNELIKNFHNQAIEELDPNTVVGSFSEAVVQRVAELIVQECLAHGKLTQSQTVVNGSEEYNAGREMGIEVFMNQIKQHFGVEE